MFKEELKILKEKVETSELKILRLIIKKDKKERREGKRIKQYPKSELMTFRFYIIGKYKKDILDIDEYELKKLRNKLCWNPPKGYSPCSNEINEIIDKILENKND